MQGALRWCLSGWRRQVVVFLAVCVTLEAMARWRLVAEGIEKAGSRGRFDPTTGFRVAMLKSGEINDDGLRDRNILRPLGPGGVRVMCLGDSVTFGSGNRYWDTYPRQLEPMLVGRPPRYIEVVNAGQLGFGLLQMAGLLFDVAERYQPQVVTLLIGFNEPYNDLKGELPLPTRNLWRRRSISDHLRVYLHKTAAYRYLKARLRPPATQEQQALYRPEPYAELTVHNVRRLAGFLDEHHIPLVVAVQGLRSHTYMLELDRRQRRNVTSGHAPQEYDPMRSGIKKLGAEMGFPVIDFTDEFARRGYKEDELFLPDDIVHLTPLGNKIVAETFARTLLTLPVVQAARLR